jgi:hypothetical protein
MITRRAHLWKGVEECLDKMYRASQPSITWNELCEKAKQDKEKGEEHFYWEEHYLSQEEYDEIYNEYADAYRAVNEWKDNCDTVIKYLTDGGLKDKWIERDGDKPGYRGYENVPSISRQIYSILNEYEMYDEDMHNELTKAVLETIKTCRDFYRFDRDAEKFMFNIMNYAPSTNIESVREFYKDTDVVIKERVYNEETDQYE